MPSIFDLAPAQVFAPGTAVIDTSDPDARGVIRASGPEQSEVKFDNDKLRYVSNEHLRAVEAPTDGLCQHNPRPDLETIRLGQEAMARKRRAWEDWIAIAKAIQVGRGEVMRELFTNEPQGKRYEKAFGAWLIANSFNEMDKGARSRLLECLKHQVDIEKWRARLTDSERFKFNHPDTVLRKWRAATVVPDPNAPKKASRVQALNDSIVSLQEENDRMKREIALGGGDLWSPEDTPKAIATIMLGKLSKSKAEKVARVILSELARAK